MKSRHFSGSHPEEHYLPATRKRMHLDKPTSHGGWPEGEYDPPVQDRIYGWYKKMKMMPEGDDLKIRDAASSEQRQDLQKGRYGRKHGYLEDPESLALAERLANQIIASEDPENSEAFQYVIRNPENMMNVWSELQTSGEYALARMLKDRARSRADEYVTQRGTDMRITESQLRRIIREEIGRINEAAARNEAAIAAIKQCWDKKISEEEVAKKLKSLNVVGEIPVLEQADYALVDERKKGKIAGGDIDWVHGFSVRIAEMQQGLKEGQRGNDENSQHDNDTDPGDPYAKKLRESQSRRNVIGGVIGGLKGKSRR